MKTFALLAFTACLVACGPSQQELDDANARAADLQSQLEASQASAQELDARIEQLTTQNGELVARLRALGEDVQDLEGQRSTLESNLEETRQALEELRARQAQAQARLATFQNLIERFRSMIESGQLRVRIVRNRMVVELPEGVLFDSARANLKDGAAETLQQVASVLASIENRQFQIAGHTDNIPIRTRRFPNNWALSTARAVTVARYLIEQNVPATRISAAGYADTQPVASNDDDEGRAQNRRIEIVLVPNLDELPDLSSLQTSE
ncbi:MAG: OmpA family protein [Myxococcota bacterium]